MDGFLYSNAAYNNLGSVQTQKTHAKYIDDVIQAQCGDSYLKCDENHKNAPWSFINLTQPVDVYL